MGRCRCCRQPPSQPHHGWGRDPGHAGHRVRGERRGGLAQRRQRSVGEVRSGLLGQPVVRYALDRADMERLRHGLVLVARTHFAAGAKRILPGVYGLPYSLGPDEVKLLEQGPLDPRACVAVISPLFGGCVMGSDPARSVVDDHGRVHGHTGLVVCDASVIPTNHGVNPQHTIMGLARGVARSRRGDW